MKTTPWRDLKHMASPDEMERVRREAAAEVERLRLAEDQGKRAEQLPPRATSEAA